MKENSNSTRNESKKGMARNPNPNFNNNNSNNKKQKTKNNNNNDAAIITKDVSLLTSLPLSLRLVILNLLAGSTQEELRNLPLVSKQFKNDCYQDAIEWEFIPLLELKRGIKEHINSIGGMFNKNTFEYHVLTNPDKFQKYCHMVVHEPRKFTGAIAQARIPKLKGILSLDLYSSLPWADDVDLSGLILPSKVPNLRELNLKADILTIAEIFENVSNHCPNLEKVSITNGVDEQGKGIGFELDGFDMQNAQNLKELYIDGANFYSSARRRNGMFTLLDPTIPIEIPADKAYDANFCILFQCRSSLERVSMRNATYCTFVYDWDDKDYFTTEEYNNEGVIPQNGLIKFIRNAPQSLCWFRSNLSKENMEMLKLERPGIEFVN